MSWPPMLTMRSITAGTWPGFCTRPEAIPIHREGSLSRHSGDLGRAEGECDKTPSPVAFERCVDRTRYANQAHKVRVTDGHETEAKAAQLRKRPNQVGLFLLKMLGFRGHVTPPTGHGPHVRPSHEHPGHHEHATPDK